MATKSVLKTIYIKDAKAANRLILALENAERKSVSDQKSSRKVSTASEDEIRSMFCADDGN